MSRWSRNRRSWRRFVADTAGERTFFKQERRGRKWRERQARGWRDPEPLAINGHELHRRQGRR